jgi:hypothetical protein
LMLSFSIVRVVLVEFEISESVEVRLRREARERDAGAD